MMALSNLNMRATPLAVVQQPRKMKRKVSTGIMKEETTRERSKKRLRFSDMSSLILTEHKTSEDLQEAWYTRSETSRFKKNAHLTSKALWETRSSKVMKHIACSAANQAPQVDIDVRGKEVIRGLEHLISPEVMKYLVERRRNVITRVLEDQEAQKMEGKGSDHLRTAKVSEIHSAFAKEWCKRITAFSA